MTVLGAVMAGFSAGSVFFRASWVVQPLAEYRVPRPWWNLLGGAARARHTTVLTGARTVASQAVTFGRLSPFARPALVNGAAGVVVTAQGRPLSVMGFTVVAGRIAAIDVTADPDRLARLDLALPGG